MGTNLSPPRPAQTSVWLLTPEDNVTTVESGFFHLKDADIGARGTQRSSNRTNSSQVYHTRSRYQRSAEASPAFKSRTALPSSSIIYHIIVDDNVNGNTSAPRTNLLPGTSSPATYKAIADQDIKPPVGKPTRTFLPQIITIGDLPHTIKYNSASQCLLGDKTLAPGFSAITISNTHKFRPLPKHPKASSAAAKSPYE